VVYCTVQVKTYTSSNHCKKQLISSDGSYLQDGCTIPSGEPRLGTVPPCLYQRPAARRQLGALVYLICNDANDQTATEKISHTCQCNFFHLQFPREPCRTKTHLTSSKRWNNESIYSPRALIFIISSHQKLKQNKHSKIEQKKQNIV
jgi:hypothetical protein